MKVFPRRLRSLFDKQPLWPASPVFSDNFWELAFPAFSFPARSGREDHFSPAVDVAEKDDCFVIEVDLPGVDPENVRVEIEDDQIVIQGQMEQKKEEKRYHYQERVWGSFYRRFPLPHNIDSEKMECTEKHGTLRITVPKKAGGTKKTVLIKKG